MKTAKWIDDKRVEDELDRIGAKYEKRLVKIADLKVEESKQNNARLGQAIDCEHSFSLAVAMDNGKPFTGIVCTPSGYVLDGNHRIDASILAGKVEIYAYVVLNATRIMREKIIRTFNASHGKSPSKDERIEQAVHLHVECKMSITNAALMQNLEYDDVQKSVYVYNIRAALEDMGVDSSRLKKTAILALKPLMKRKNVLKSVAILAASEQLVAAKVQDLVNKVKKKATDSGANKVISQWRSQIVTKSDTRGPFPEAQRLTRNISALSQLVTDCGSKTLHKVGIKTEEDRIALQKEWRDVKKVIDRWFNDARKNKPK